ncbi:hypothetical protein MUO32_14160 [Shinella sp. CPCC 101442]|uniref:hypothetical protein n=1 Tax=Shinella sp. CPCC 101442 TaxID=2932265 RepID=UPI002152EEBF|nr:hypothetical protein [Shinella sp. CPCC 101442]MCR6500189.1 hypothetical protein [Shinella sp. CPCC 101442]
MGKRLFAAAAMLAAILSSPAEARIIYTIVADAGSNEVIMEKGDGKTRVTPASIFNAPLAVMGYDSGFLESGLSRPKIQPVT